MKLVIHGRNLEVTPAIRDYTETKLTRAISNFGEMVREADVHLSVARNPRVPQQIAEVTMYANGTGVAQDLARATELFERADVALMSDESNTSCTTQRSALRLEGEAAGATRRGRC